MSNIFERIANCYDSLHQFWENEDTQRVISAGLVFFFVLAVVVIEMKVYGLLPEAFSPYIPENHFYAVKLAFTFILLLEIVSLVFILPMSVSGAMAKQLEIVALILLRNCFKELVNFEYTVTLAGHMPEVYRISANAAGALAIFVILGVFSRLQFHRPALMPPDKRYRFVITKKLIALFLLLAFFESGIHFLVDSARGVPTHDFFESFFTILIFADILLILISQQYLPAFHAIFRNSGFALATLIIRLSLTAPPYQSVFLAVGASLFALALTAAYAFVSPKEQQKPAADCPESGQ